MVLEVIKIIKQLKAEGTTILLVEQNLAMALKLTDYIYIFDKMSVVFAGTNDQLNRDVMNKFLP
ncbi:hypothetical protein ACFY5J_00800 [Peribacillus butanolivorans]|uniref:hypothetical protein n=1 Tax=Peribacillus butanolivorans TaxID=421767 RepID=UPI00363969D1